MRLTKEEKTVWNDALVSYVSMLKEKRNPAYSRDLVVAENLLKRLEQSK